MNNLLLSGYGRSYIIRNKPVDVNIVKSFIEGYTVWTAKVDNNTVLIDIANDQIIFTYSVKVILIKEEVKNNNIVISVLTFISYTKSKCRYRGFRYFVNYIYSYLICSSFSDN
jgi:hypothetical protein